MVIFPVADTVAAIPTLQQTKQTLIVKKTFSVCLLVGKTCSVFIMSYNFYVTKTSTNIIIIIIQVGGDTSEVKVTCRLIP